MADIRLSEKEGVIMENMMKCLEPNQYLKIEIYYSLGGYNNFTSRQEKRGYYISVIPVTRENDCERYVAFRGYKRLLVECVRRSKKSERLALGKAQEIKEALITLVLEKNNLKLAKE